MIVATLKDISERIGISATTISRVLNNDETIAVSKETRRAIFETAYELGYMPPRRRKQLKNALKIGVADWRIIIDTEQHGGLNALRSFSGTVAPEQEIEYIRIRKGEVANVDGILAFGELTEGEISALLKSSKYITFINGEKSIKGSDCVQVDLDLAWEQGLLRFADSDSIGYIGGLFHGDGYMIGRRRNEYVVSLLKRMGKYHPAHISIGDFTGTTGYFAMKTMLLQKNVPAAVVVGSDIIAAGVFDALGEAGITSGRDIHLLIYQDIPSTHLPEGQYAILQAYPDILWEKAIQMLLEKFQGRTEAITTVITPKLLIKV